MEATEHETQDTVNPSDLRGEALAEALAKAQADESGEDTATPLGGKEMGDEPTPSGEDNAEGQKASAEGTDTVQDTTTPEGGEESEIEKLRRQNAEKEKFAQRKATEAGELQKQLLELQRMQLPQINPDEWGNIAMENPQLALAQAQEVERKRQAFQEQERLVIRTTNEETVKSIVPDFDSLTAEIAEIAKSDGAKPEHIAAFQADPFGTSDVSVLLTYASRAKQLREMNRLKSELESVKAKTKTVTQNIEKAAKAKPAMPDTAGTSTSVKPPVDESQILNMSSEERNKLLEQMIAEENSGG